ncbi:MAG: hypothetical protein IT370_07650, partial [Deltaproteobacteria bacterium]|nr:hypothetical protein [Deltaproteobacteria bacterium]
MNGVVSGDAGIAFVIEGRRTYLLRAESPATLVETPAALFPRLFAGVSDPIFVEGVTLDAIQKRLDRAHRGRAVLSLALIALDGEAPAEERSEAMAALAPLLGEAELLQDLEAVLSAAPFPAGADLSYTLAAVSGGPMRELLERLRARQDAITNVRAAWDALPDELFEGPEERRVARAVAVREGLFLALVREVASGRDTAAFVMGALKQRVLARRVGNAAKVILEWAAPFASSVPPPPESEALPGQLADEPVRAHRLGHRDRRPPAPVSRNPGAKLLVEEVFARFPTELLAARRTGQEAVRSLLDTLRARLLQIHGTKAEDRPHFAKSVANAADTLTRQGETMRAIELLEWGLGRGIADTVNYSALVDAYGKAGDLPRAQSLFDEARQLRMADAFTYNALMGAYGKAGDLPRAQSIFDRATQLGIANAFTYNTLVDAYGKAGDLPRAQGIFDRATQLGIANAPTYNALMDAYGKAGDVLRAQSLFDQATQLGIANAVTYNALMDAYGKAGDLPRAQSLFDQTTQLGISNAVTYNTLMDAYGKAGDLP